MKRAILKASIVIAVMMPLAAFAEDQSQLQTLLDQIAALKQQILNMQNQQPQKEAAVDIDTFAVGASAQSPRVCVAPARTLSRGDEGDDVANLQIFLARNATIYPEGKVTGYYGPATERAIQRLQTKYGILGKGSPSTTGWGAIGQKTLTLLRQLWSCGGAIVSGWFIANPNYGPSPLSVVFSAQASSSRPLGAAFIVDFGDGSIGNTTVSNSICNSIAGPCSSIVAVGHRYTRAGSYTAKLTLIQTRNSCIAYPQECPGSPTGFCTTLAPTCTTEKTNTDAGTVTVTAEAAADGVHFVVRDTGPGIPPEHLPLIFDRFYKADASRKAASGSGLGLSIVKAIIERHGGSITARNDGGAVFEIVLPPRPPIETPAQK